MGDVDDRVRSAIERIAAATRALGLDLGLRPGASLESLAAAEAAYGRTLPEAVRAYYRYADGQSDSAVPLLGTWPTPTLRRAVQELSSQRSFWGDHEGPDEGPPQVDPEVRHACWRPGWWPLGFWQGSEMLVVDRDPAPGGVDGQLVATGSHMEGSFWTAPGLLELLEAMADGIDSGLVAPIHHGIWGGMTWSAAPSGMPFEHVGHELFGQAPDPVARPELPPQWRAWLDARGPRFGEQFDRWPNLTTVPPACTDLSPLDGRSPAVLDLTATTLRALAELPDIVSLRTLRVRGIESLDRVGRFSGLKHLMIVDSPAVDLEPLTERPGITLELDGPWGSGRPDGLGYVRAVARSLGEAQRIVDLRPARWLWLELDGDIDAAALDWSGHVAPQIRIGGGRLSELGFLEHLPPAAHFTSDGAVAVDLTGMPTGAELELRFQRVQLPRNGERLCELRLPTGISAPYEWHRRFGAADALVWSGFSDVEDGSPEQEEGTRLFLARHEWSNAEATKRRARDPRWQKFTGLSD